MSVEADRQASVDDSGLAAQRREVYEAVREIAEQRAVIEQAKGMLMFIYGIDADAAFDILRWQSQQHNVKLRLVAEQIAKDMTELARTTPPRNRITHDRLLLTAHQRIADVAARQRNGQSEAGD
ncbi:ANTAR domain-containing protein [Mycolicibacterium hodleri]|uniref:ANTAR domain-containing protein n=1 Tax=Mycolicibacterium hodleri TaxID=49897 RepID=A0A502E7N3_9MYCO|nr:ANTAR domain-containing protein [Mycolicibacterium hodleri]TPG32506.1 ANTAR domain-containing protein [Mycolicibacterium hodleri]